MKKTLVVIPLYNKEETILRTVSSVLNQTYKEFDLLVVNDGSTDKSQAIVESLDPKNIKSISQSNNGVSNARNVGLKYAQDNGFDIVAFLDADDYWLPNHLSAIHNLFDSNKIADVAATNYQIKYTASKQKKTAFSNFPEDQPELIGDFFHKNYLNTILTSSSYAIKTAALEKIGMYNENFTHGEDIDYLIRIGIHLKVAFSTQETVIIDKILTNRLSKKPVAEKQFLDLDVYEEKDVDGLKKYLDINRFSIAIGYRLQNDIKNAAIYQHQIDLNNLTKKQRKLLEMSTRQLKALKRTQKILGNLGFRLRTGR